MSAITHSCILFQVALVSPVQLVPVVPVEWEDHTDLSVTQDQLVLKVGLVGLAPLDDRVFKVQLDLKGKLGLKVFKDQKEKKVIEDLWALKVLLDQEAKQAQ